jgi:MSHA biogenesis protein MshJ
VIKTDQLNEWWKRRKPREQLLVIASAALILLLTADTLLLKPMRSQIADYNQRLAGARGELAKLQQLMEQRERAGSEQLRAREADLEARLTTAESDIHNAQLDLVSPQEMARQLAAILHGFPQLHVVGMQSESPIPFDDGADKSGKATPGDEARASMLYEHGLELTVEGRYLDLIAYLQQLERTPYKIYWRDLELKVNAQGVPVTKVRFFTLSRGPTWLTL